jgi:hypothetical protein
MLRLRIAKGEAMLRSAQVGDGRACSKNSAMRL